MKLFTIPATRKLGSVRQIRWLVTAVLFCVVMLPSSHGQANVVFEAFDLRDSTPGQDLWRYDYRISDAEFQQGQGFSILFVPSLYASLGSPLAGGSADWSVIAVQPDRILNDSGYFDGLALKSAPNLATEFSVTFVWLGAGTPGAQAFDFYNADFSTRFSGQTVTVPEPDAKSLIATSLLALLALRQIRSPKSTTKKV